MKQIKDINDIDTGTAEGRLLLAALAMLTTESRRNSTPWEVIQDCSKLAEHMFNEDKVKDYFDTLSGQDLEDALIDDGWKKVTEKNVKEIMGSGEITRNDFIASLEAACIFDEGADKKPIRNKEKPAEGLLWGEELEKKLKGE